MTDLSVTPWFKNWHREQTAPLGRLRRLSGHYYSTVGASLAYERLKAERGEDHPATRAAWGRLAFHAGFVPQLGCDSIEAIAWFRESGSIEGYRNRAERRSWKWPS